MIVHFNLLWSQGKIITVVLPFLELTIWRSQNTFQTLGLTIPSRVKVVPVYKMKEKASELSIASVALIQSKVSRKHLNYLHVDRNIFLYFSLVYIVICFFFKIHFTFYADLLKIFSNLLTLEINICQLSWKIVSAKECCCPLSTFMPSVSFWHLSKMTPVCPTDLSLTVHGEDSGLRVVWLHSQWRKRKW